MYLPYAFQALINCPCPCIFQHRNPTGWGSQRVQIQLLTNLKGHQTKVKVKPAGFRNAENIFISMLPFIWLFYQYLHKIRACLLQKSGTRMTASVLTQDPNTQKVEKNAEPFSVFGSCLLQSEFPRTQPHTSHRLALD